MKKSKLVLLGLLSLLVLSGCKSKNNSSSNSNVSSSTNYSTSSNFSTNTSMITSNSTNNDKSSLTPVPNPTERIYLIGAAVWGWSNYAELTLMNDNVYYGTFDLKTTTEGFVMTSQKNYDGYVFKTSSNSNFTVTKYGTYEVCFTYDVSKTDATWSRATEKNNAKTGYYKITLESSVQIPIDIDMVYVSGAALSGWGTYLPLFIDEETSIYSYIYGLSNSAEGFIITSEEDNLHEVYHKASGGNISVKYSGDYRIMFTYNDMSAEEGWTILKEQNNGRDGYYKLEAVFGVPDDEPENPNPEPENPTPEPEPGPGEDITESYMYIFGDVFNNWESSTQLPLVSENTYELTADFGVGSFIICELNEISTNGSKLKNEVGKNFEITHAGSWTLTITRNDMSSDSNWKTTTEANNGITLAKAYYKLIPNFEIIEQEVIIENIYINGMNVGGWDSYSEIKKINENLYQGQVNLSTHGDGFVITAQKSRNATDIVFKHIDGKNLNVDTAGKYTISFSLVEQDDTWVEVIDSKGNYKNSCYVKLELYVDTRTNVIQNENVSAVASSVSGSRTVDKIYDMQIGDTARWESTQKVDPQWIKVDLGASYTISGLDIQWHGRACAKDYEVYFTNDVLVYESYDGTSFDGWTNIITVTNGTTTQNRLDTHSFNEVSARYIVIKGTSRNYEYGYSIGELYVWGN